MRPHDTTPLKHCASCGTKYPATPEHFHRDKNRKDGLYPNCKACEHRRTIARREQKAAYDLAYREANRDKLNQQSRDWQHANSEYVKKYKRQYYLDNQDKEKERTRKWLQENRDRSIRYFKEHYRKNKRKKIKQAAEYRRNNPDMARAIRARRRARKRNAEGTYTAEDVQRQYKAQKGKCYYCGCKVGDNYHVDHVVPLSRGGTNWPENLVIACASCNSSKQDKLPHEWPEGGRLL